MIKKLVFVSVPMSGKDNVLIHRAIQVTRNKYVQKTKCNIREIAFIDNFDSGLVDDKFEEMLHPPVAYLGRAIKRLALCTEAIFGEGWENARGCRIEHEVCKEYGIEIIE